MKDLGKFEQDIVDGGKAEASLGIDGEMLSAQIAIKYPIAKIVEPALKAVDSLVDQLEDLIPGDQKAIAQKAKAEARASIVAALAE